MTRWNDFACKHSHHTDFYLALSWFSKLKISNFFFLLKQITQIEPTGRLESSSQDRLTALQAVTTFGAPAEVFDSEGECPGPQVAGSCPPQAGRCAAMSALMNLMFAPENHST